MVNPKDTVQALRHALEFSPDNVPLRQHLADALLSLGQPAEAEYEYRYALNLAPGHPDIRYGLTRAFYQQGKHSQAMVLVEDLLKGTDATAQVYILHARLLLNTGALQHAVQQYLTGIELDPTAQDAELAVRLDLPMPSSASSPTPQPPVQDASLLHYPESYSNYPVNSFPRAAGLGSTPIPTTFLPQPTPADVVEQPTITFADIGGMDVLKEEIRLKIIYPMQHPEMYRMYGKAVGGGILMYGPPGCGKTHLARATAGEIQAGFIAVGINDVLDLWLGKSERNLHDLFEQARRNQPCVLFFDEVDALAANRSDMRHSGGRQLINQFLLELDGVQSSNEGVLVLAATNAPWHLDTAFRRPGRFDRILFVPPPDAIARAGILRLLCQGKPVADIDFDYLSQQTEHLSGADLEALVDRAVEQKLQEAMKTGIPQPLTTHDLATVAALLKPSTGEWFASARNYALYANQGGLYDDVLKYTQV
jgi:transitional endoplasmic reticulum ATPase